MRLPAFLLLIWLLPALLKAQSKPVAGASYSPALVLNAMRLLREQRGELNSTRLQACLRNSADERWSDLQAHFYCWLKPDQRACFTGAVDGDLIDHPELKGNYDLAFTHCLQAKGRAYAINFDRPLARLTVEQGEVFKNLLYRRPLFAKDEQRKILETFYAGRVPERRQFPPRPTPRPTPGSAASPTGIQSGSPSANRAKAVAPVPSPAKPAPLTSVAAAEINSDAALGDPDFDNVQGVDDNGLYPLSCQIKMPGTRTRQKPDAGSPTVAVVEAIAVKVTGPAQSSTGKDVMQWYPIEFSHRGQSLRAWLPVSQVDCAK